MKRHLSAIGQYNIVEAEIEEGQISGIGDYYAPRIMMPLVLNIAHGYLQEDEGIIFRRINVKLCLAGVSQVISEAGKETNLLITKQFNANRIWSNLEFPIDSICLNFLEKYRNGGDLKLRVDVTVSADRMRALSKQPLIWGYFERSLASLAEDMTIPRDAWLSRVLPHVGCGVVHILEFPAVQLEACQELKHSFDALRQAQERHKIGLYDDAVGKCRVALDPFFESIEKPDHKGVVRRVLELPRSWQTKLGEATYAWLDGAFAAIKEAGNVNHHSPNPHYDQLESQMIVGITAAILAFVAKTKVAQKK